MSGDSEGGGSNQFAEPRRSAQGVPTAPHSRNRAGGASSKSETLGCKDRGKLEQAIRHHLFHHEETPDTIRVEDMLDVDGTIHFRQFLSALMEHDPRYFRAALERLRQEHVPLLVICETLIVPIAEELGRMWCEDTESFASVTAASSRLQLLLTSLTDADGPSFYDEERPRILLMRMPSNDHTLGLSVIASVFHDEGWMVDGGPSLQSGKRAYDMARNGGYKVIGVSLAVASTTQDVATVIKNIRAACRGSDTKILLGGPALARREDALHATGADIVALDVRQAVQQANAMIARQAG
ncbi:B12-binding domain-containing protein [Hoeflea sp.]|uniref:cobalamin B12-binding domain-containing protein n=1 Tax=Hoeflea sp. TaxID=1940281 RepID=UPI00374A935F